MEDHLLVGFRHAVCNEIGDVAHFCIGWESLSLLLKVDVVHVPARAVGHDPDERRIELLGPELFRDAICEHAEVVGRDGIGGDTADIVQRVVGQKRDRSAFRRSDRKERDLGIGRPAHERRAARGDLLSSVVGPATDVRRGPSATPCALPDQRGRSANRREQPTISRRNTGRRRSDRERRVVRRPVAGTRLRSREGDERQRAPGGQPPDEGCQPVPASFRGHGQRRRAGRRRSPRVLRRRGRGAEDHRSERNGKGQGSRDAFGVHASVSAARGIRRDIVAAEVPRVLVHATF